MDPNAAPGIKISQILLDRAEFGHRADFLEHPHTSKVELDVEFSFTAAVDPDTQHAVCRLSVKTAPGQLYTFMVEMAALIEVDTSSPNFPLDEYARTNAWVLLFPFLRETVANLTGRGRFGAVWIPPLNIPATVKEVERAQAEEGSSVEM